MTKKIINLINKTPDKPACYILRGDSGDLLIDTGYFLCKPAVDAFVSRYNVKWIFLTHGHFDHSWNAKYLKEKYGCRIILHEKDRDLYQEHKYTLLKPTRRRYKMRTAAGNILLKRLRPPACEVDYYLTDRDTDFLRKLGFDAEIVMLPGHTAGCMGILANDVLYAGDACSSVRAQYRTIYLAADVEAARESEKKLRRLRPAVICAGHGSPIDFTKAE